MEINVEHIALLARLSISAGEKEKFSRQLGGILDYIKKLEELDTTGIEPTSHVIEMRNVMRDDRLRPSLPKDEALMNAPDRTGDFYRVPKIIE